MLDYNEKLNFIPCNFIVGYTTRDVIYKWNTARQVAISKDMKLSQFDLVANPTANESTEPSLAQSEYWKIKYIIIITNLKKSDNFLSKIEKTKVQIFFNSPFINFIDNNVYLIKVTPII